MNRLALVLMGSLLVPDLAAAQAEGRFQTGIVSWTPTLTLRDAGVDTNLYDEPANPKRDTSAVFGPHVSGVAKLAAADVRFDGGADFVYFHQYTAERSINRGANGRVVFRGSRLRPYVHGSILDSRERSSVEIDIRARRAVRSGGAGLGIQLTPRGVLEAGGSFSRSTYRQGEIFRGVELAQRLNRESLGVDLRFKYDVTPLTRIVLEGGRSEERFMRSPAYNMNNLQVRGGFEFDPDAVLDGRVMVGFHRVEPIGTMAVGFEGPTVALQLGYVLLQRTRFQVRIARDTTYSMEAQPYFLQTTYGGEIRHNLLGPLDVIGRASTDSLEYPGIPERLIVADSLRMSRYGGALAVQPGPHLQLSINYEHATRDSEAIPERRFQRDRLYTTIIYGF